MFNGGTLRRMATETGDMPKLLVIGDGDAFCSVRSMPLADFESRVLVLSIVAVWGLQLQYKLVC